ncbi:TNT domain-containing protein [Mycobacterium sp. D16Q16]|uniref:TNT domain-containing protein n=1 Tax=Mycobacterium sp. D16Q16 TaxID=1855659 RepID=UPI00099240EB|nr:TNT domain-containing protein [Mycobacterium sp. D16Q16]
MTTLDEFMAVNPNAYMAVVDTWRPQTTQFKEAFDDYKRWAGSPAGTEWTGRTANAAYERAAIDCHGSDNADDAAEDIVTLASATITHEVLPPLNNGKTMIENALRAKDQGVSIDQSFTMSYTPPEGMSEETAQRNRDHVADAERQIKEYVAKWEKGCQTLKGQADTAAQKITGCINPKTAFADGRKILRDTAAPGQGPTTVTATAINYKELYPKKTTPAGTDPAGAGGTESVDYKKLYPKTPAAATDPAASAPRVGSLTDNLLRIDPTMAARQSHVEKTPGQAVDPNSPAGKAAIDGLRGMYQSKGLPPAQVEAKVQEALKAGGQDRYAVKFADPNAPSATPSEHVSRDFGEQFNKFTNGISDAATRTVDGQIEQGKILTGQAGPGAPGVAEAWKELGMGAARQAHELTTDPLAAPKMGIEQAKDFINSPSEFIGKNIIHGTEALAGGVVGGEVAAGTRGLLGDLGAAAGPEARALTHGLEDAAPGHHSTPQVEHPAISDQGASTGHGSSSGPAPSAGHLGPSDAPVAGHDFGLTPSSAFEHVQNPADDLARLHQGGVPSHITDGYEQLAGRTVDQFQQEFTVPRSDGGLRWDWDNQAPNSGFAGSPTVTDHIPKDYALDRLGWEKGAFLADDGAPLSTRSMPPGVASQYNQYVGTGQRIPEDLNWEVRHGPAAPAFGQPGGANQWVVIDKTTGNEVPVKDLLDEGLLGPAKGNR